MRDRLIELFYDNNVHCDQKIEELADDVMDTITESVTVQEWISVKDRLPKPFTPVLVYRQSFGTLPPYIKVDKMTLWSDDTQVWTDEVGNWKNVTTHWMPLPQPPKGDGEMRCTEIDEEEILDLINRQKAELDDLKRDDLPRCKDALRRANEIGMGLEKENQELRAEVAILRACKKQQMDEIKFLSASRLSMWDELNAHRIGYDKGVKEFAERLKANTVEFGSAKGIQREVDNLVKEMVGEDNGEA